MERIAELHTEIEEVVDKYVDEIAGRTRACPRVLSGRPSLLALVADAVQSFAFLMERNNHAQVSARPPD